MTDSRRIEIAAPNFRSLNIDIEGLPPGLLCDRYGEETAAAIADREANPGRKAAKRPRNPEKDFAQSVYRNNGDYGFPAAAFHLSLISAAGRFGGLKNMGPTLAGAISVVPNAGDLIRVAAGDPEMRTDPRGIKGVRASLIYRAWFREWSATLPLTYDADLFEEDQIVNLVARAGVQVGVGNWRPEKKGQFGRWQVVGGRV